MNETRIVALGLIPLFVGAALVVGLRRPAEVIAGPAAQPAVSAHAAGAPQPGALRSRRYVGVVVSGYSADIASEFGGSIVKLWASAGEHVREGQRLLQIDPRSASEEIKMARAKLAQERSSVERARAELREASDLVERLAGAPDGVSAREQVAARTRQEQAQATLAAAAAGLGMQRARLDQQVVLGDKHVVRAPFDGVLVARYLDPGDVAMPGQVLLRVISDDRYVRFAMPPDALLTEPIGSAVEVVADDRELTLRGTISDVQPEIDASAQLVFARARLQLDASERESIIAGMRVEVVPAAPSHAQVTEPRSKGAP
jgi:RND family efflux transporter MFP subunit